VPSPAERQPRVIHLGLRSGSCGAVPTAPGAPTPSRAVRARGLARVPAVTVLVVASLLWPFLVLGPLTGSAGVRLVEDPDAPLLGGGLGPAAALPVAARERLVVEDLGAVREITAPEIQGPGTVLDPSAMAASGIPEVALRAYRAAEATVAVDDPGCRLPWWLLAGIGRVESGHGQFAGAVLLSDGTSSPRIVGIPLDGRPGVATILDTDDGLMDGDTTYDRAVGPMQFIPGTWSRWAADGDGDGRSDVHDLDDTALAAGRYLCAGGRDLSTEEGLREAVFSYNRSDAYVALVLAIGRAYATGDTPVLPVGPAPAAAPTASPTSASPTTAPPTSAPTTTAPPTTAPPSTGPTPTAPPTTDPTASPTDPTPSPTCTTGGPTTDPTTSPSPDPTAPPEGTCPPCPTETAPPTGEPTPSPTDPGPTDPGPTDPGPTTPPTCTPVPTGTTTP
jgi:hypothetical protein